MKELSCVLLKTLLISCILTSVESQCEAGTYGTNCALVCGYCAGGAVCDLINGKCPGGCGIVGHKPPYCNATCDNGTWGKDCSSVCGYCADYKPCNKVTGTCDHGCEPGLQQPDCKQACQLGRYGKNCSMTCNQCPSGPFCNHVTGSCPGYTPPGCTMPGYTPPGYTSPGFDNHVGLTGGEMAALVIGCILFGCIPHSLIIFYRRRKDDSFRTPRVIQKGFCPFKRKMPSRFNDAI